MSLGVLNNIAGIYAQNNLNRTQANLQKTLNELSSGSRINSGADDAAGLAVADGLHANQAALTQSALNASSGVGLLQTADGALSQVTNLLNRAVTLAAEVANGTLNTAQNSAANQEYQNILTQIGNIGSSTNFNGLNVFTNSAVSLLVSDGTSSGATTYAEVVGALTKGTVGLSAPTATTAAIALTTPTASSSSTASHTTLTLATAGDTLSGTLSLAVGSGTAHSITVAAGTTLTALAAQINADSTFSGASVTAAISSGVLTISGPASASSTLVTTGTSLTETTPAGTTAGAGVDFTASSIAQLSASTAATVLTSVTTAIADVAYQRGVIGAEINQLNSAANVATAESENLTAAESNIRSTNYGQATSDVAKYKVLSETGIAALAQANSVQQEVLKLLQ